MKWTVSSHEFEYAQPWKFLHLLEKEGSYFQKGVDKPWIFYHYFDGEDSLRPRLFW